MLSKETLDLLLGEQPASRRERLVKLSNQVESLPEVLIALAQEAEDPAKVLRICPVIEEAVSIGHGASSEAVLRLRILILEGDAWRAQGKFEEAEMVLRTASEALAIWPEPNYTLAGAELALGYGLLFWEKGQFDLGESLLRQSAKVFGEVGNAEREAISWTLLGLIHSERLSFGHAAQVLESARQEIKEERVWIRFVACLEEAWARAWLGEHARAWQIIRTAPALFRGKPEAKWLIGRALTAIGESEGRQLLSAASSDFMDEENLVLTVLCTVDLLCSATTKAEVTILSGEIQERLGIDLDPVIQSEILPNLGRNWEERAGSVLLTGARIRAGLRRKGFSTISWITGTKLVA